MKYLVSVEAVIVKGDRFLITRRGKGEEYLPGVLSIPGGGVEGTGNVPLILEENLRREIMEEVGVIVEDKVEYLESKLFPFFNENVVDVVFLCTYLSGDARPIDTEEVTAVYWMTYSEAISAEDMPEWTKDSLKLAAKKLGWI